MENESEEETERRQRHEYRCEVAANVRTVSRAVNMNRTQKMVLLAAAAALEDQP